MKKLIATTIIFSGLLIAGEPNRFNDMKNMEDALVTIQKGFLYTNKTMVKDGVKVLKENNKMDAHIDAVKSYLPKDKQNLFNNAIKEAKSINTNADLIVKSIESKEYAKAHDSYAKILNSCTHCHLVIRNWK
jgi:hypothetical protein